MLRIELSQCVARASAHPAPYADAGSARVLKNKQPLWPPRPLSWSRAVKTLWKLACPVQVRICGKITTRGISVWSAAGSRSFLFELCPLKRGKKRDQQLRASSGNAGEATVHRIKHRVKLIGYLSNPWHHCLPRVVISRAFFFIFPM